jgi:hypothetical protein
MFGKYSMKMEISAFFERLMIDLLFAGGRNVLDF